MAKDEILSGLGLLLDYIEKDIEQPGGDKVWKYGQEYEDKELYGIVFHRYCQTIARWPTTVSTLKKNATQSSLLTALKRDVIGDVDKGGKARYASLAEALNGLKRNADVPSYIKALSWPGPVRDELSKWAHSRIECLCSIVTFDRVVSRIRRDAKDEKTIEGFKSNGFELLGAWWGEGETAASEDSNLNSLLEAIYKVSEIEREEGLFLSEDDGLLSQKEIPDDKQSWRTFPQLFSKLQESVSDGDSEENLRIKAREVFGLNRSRDSKVKLDFVISLLKECKEQHNTVVLSNKSKCDISLDKLIQDKESSFKNRIDKEEEEIRLALKRLHDTIGSEEVDLGEIWDNLEGSFWLPEAILDESFWGEFERALKRTFPEDGLVGDQSYDALISELVYFNRDLQNQPSSDNEKRAFRSFDVLSTCLVAAMVGPGKLLPSIPDLDTDYIYTYHAPSIPSSSGTSDVGWPTLQRIVLTGLEGGLCSYFTKIDGSNLHSEHGDRGGGDVLRIGFKQSWCEEAREYLYLSDSKISREHAEIRQEDGGWVIESKSQWGTLVVRGRSSDDPLSDLPRYLDKYADDCKTTIRDGDILIFIPTFLPDIVPNFSRLKDGEKKEAERKRFNREMKKREKERKENRALFPLSEDKIASLDLTEEEKKMFLQNLDASIEALLQSLNRASAYAYRFEVVPKLAD